MTFFEDQPLYSHTTMQLGGKAKYLCSVNNEQEVLEAAKFAKEKDLKIITLGSGSNIVFSDLGFDGLVIINKIMGLNINQQTKILESGAGVIWDEVVDASVKAGFSGIESLSLIPGTMGGGPVNNIGAYGQEIKDTLIKVRAYDTQNNKFVELSNADCNLSYRNSIFKSTEHGRYIIISVSLQLKDGKAYNPPTYASLQSALDEAHITNPTIQDIRNAVINIRTSKLPDPKIIPNCGSFFKNPVVDNAKRDELLKTYPNLAYFDYKGKTKLAAGWLIDNAGLKGFSKDGIKIYQKQALVLVNEGTRSFMALQQMIDHIKKTIKDLYGVELETEPEIK